MKLPSISCDPRLLQLSLTDDLSEQEEEALAGHLSDLRSPVGARWNSSPPVNLHWQRIGDALRDESKTSQRPPTTRIRRRRHERDDWVRASSQITQPRRSTLPSTFLLLRRIPASLGRLGDIDILQVIGHGGMGIVLKGFQAALNRLVAVKVLAPHLATSGAARQRFAREAQAAAAIVHPNVMPIFTVDGSGKLPYLVMPYIDGESLQQRIDRQGALETVDILRIGLQVSRGLAAAHAQGLVHRDIKPANMLLERGVDRVLLTDFGLARAADDASLTRTGFIAGTPQFMSPEQARGDSIDTRSDLFSLGSVLYTMCTGRPPFRADSSYGVLRRITDYDPRPIADSQPSVPIWLVSLVNRLLAKRVDDRFQNADRVAEIMEQCLAHVQQPTHVALPTELCPRRSQQPLSVRAIWAVTAMLVLAGVGLTMWSSKTEGTTGSADNTNRIDVPSAVSTVVETASPHTADWNDNVTSEIENLENDVQQLRRRVDLFWD